MHSGLHPFDLVMIAIYFLGITLLGLWAGRKIRGAGDYFMPRRFGKGMMTMHAFGTGTASDQAVSVASATFRGGLSGIWYQWLWLFVTPFYWLIAPIFRRFRATTTADVYELRFDTSVAVLFALVGIANLCVKMGLMLKGAGELIVAGTGAMVAPNQAILALTVMILIYGIAGGLAAAILTDYIQGILMVLFSFMLLPFIFSEVGGMGGIRESIQEPSFLSLVAPGKIGFFFILMMGVQALVGIVAQPFIMSVCGAGKSEWECRVGFVAGNLIKRACTAAWSLTAIAAVAWYIQSGVDLTQVDGDRLYGEIAQHFLPQIAPGVLGLFIAALLAGVMSSCDSFMISSSALFTQNIYKRFHRRADDKHLLVVGRIMSLFVVFGGVAFAYWTPNVIKALEIWFMIAPMMGLVFWLGLFWTRLNVAGAWTITLTGFFTWWLTTRDGFILWLSSHPLSDALKFTWTEQGQTVVYMPWQIVFYMTAALLTGILVSLLTPAVDPKKLARFYELITTPVQPGEKITQSCALPKNTPPTEREILLQGFGLRIYRPSRMALWGFLLSWAWVIAIILGFIGFVKLG